MPKMIDLAGQKYGRLTVLERGPDAIVGKSKIHFVRWWCQCECGNKTLVKTNTLRQGKVKSCGCLHVELATRLGCNNKRQNQYIFEEDLGIGFTQKGEKFYFDKSDFDLISPFCWYIDNKGYVCTRQKDKEILLHRLVMNAQPGEYVDHINHQILNACKSNLRKVSLEQNAQNSCLLQSNTSGVTGVSYDKATKKWIAYICVDGNRKTLGRFRAKEEAVAARKAAEEKYYGEYSYDNSMAASPVIEVA